jgi:hypothetical protein
MTCDMKPGLEICIRKPDWIWDVRKAPLETGTKQDRAISSSVEVNRGEFTLVPVLLAWKRAIQGRGKGNIRSHKTF